MKKILFVLTVCTLFITGCREEKSNSQEHKPSFKMTPQEFFDTKLHKSEIVDSAGHMYYFYEYGVRGYQNYAFDLEHRMDCKACLDIFD